MSKTAAFLLAASLAVGPGALFSQSQSPDQQQETKPKPSPKENQPQTDTGEPKTGQSPDIQQEKNSPIVSKPRKKNKNNARQAHGTPKPKTATATDR